KVGAAPAGSGALHLLSLGPGAQGCPLLCRLLAEAEVEAVVEHRGDDEPDDEGDVADLWVVLGNWAGIGSAVRKEIDGYHESSRHGDETLPANVSGVIEHVLVAIVSVPQPVVDEHHRQPGSYPVADQ